MHWKHSRFLQEAETEAERKKNIIAVLDSVSKKLGNSRAICKKYYVHPGLLRLYEENEISRYTRSLDQIENRKKFRINSFEKVLLKILKEAIGKVWKYGSVKLKIYSHTFTLPYTSILPRLSQISV